MRTGLLKIAFLSTLFFSLIATAAGDSSQTTCTPKAVKKTASPAAKDKKTAVDTLEIIARCSEIPGTFPANDLYNYVYIMKYHVTKVLKGSYKGEDILVGEYNPLIPRNKIADKMKPFVKGDVQKFEEGAVHRLVLLSPLENIWKDAMEDEYTDSPLKKYYAQKTDVSK